MKMYRIILTALLIMFGIISSYGQDFFDLEIDSVKRISQVPELSKAEMYADFDALISIMERCSARAVVQKKITGYDMIAEMKKLRNNIDSIDNMAQFIKLLNKVFRLSVDIHCSMIGPSVFMFRYDFYEDAIKINNITGSDFGINYHYYDFYKGEHGSELNLIYNQGKYFLKNTTTFFGDNDSITIPALTQIINFNNIPVIEYFDSHKSQMSNWDFNRRIFYLIYEIYLPNQIYNMSFNLDNKIKDVNFTKLTENKRTEAPYPDRTCKWFARDSILYIKLPSMSHMSEELKRCIPEARQRAQDLDDMIFNCGKHPIKSVIIDIRDNRGGNDSAWISLLGMIIKKPIEYPFFLIQNDDDDVLARYPPEKSNTKRITFNFIDSTHKFRVFDEEIDTIAPQSNNLAYDGDIYVLINEYIYSSAEAFASLCTKTNKIKTVGMPGGLLGGQGVNSGIFILPKSRLIFNLNLLLDASTVSKPEDFYHQNVSYPVNPSLDYYKYWYDPSRPHEIDEEAMYIHDEVFKKALEVIKSGK
jgi:hypothetical protein